MSPIEAAIDELEGAALEHPEGALPWPDLARLAHAYTAWHGDTRETCATRRADLLVEVER